jgi:hypothetical protein
MVRRTAQEFGVPYHDFTTFPSAIASHFDYLHQVGMDKIKIRLGD